CECQPTGPGDAQSLKTCYDHPDEVKMWLVKMLPIKTQKPRSVVLVEHKAQEDATEPRKLKVGNWMENQQLQGLHVEGRQQKEKTRAMACPPDKEEQTWAQLKEQALCPQE
ncbi:hypothetical protein U0070_025012, partial [Myodes glareolus]